MIKTEIKNFNGIQFEYLEGHEPTEEQIAWIEEIQTKAQFKAWLYADDTEVD